MKYQTPDHEGHFWAKLIHPSGMPDNEEWRSPDYEVVQVHRNIMVMDGKAREEGIQEFIVAVPGISPSQNVEDFVWGPEVPHFKPEKK